MLSKSNQLKLDSDPSSDCDDDDDDKNNVTITYVISYQLKLIKISAKLANLNDYAVYAVPCLSHAAANLCWYYYIYI